MKTTSTTPSTTEAIKLLDTLLSVEVRSPGRAAKLPAVIRITETLESAAGKDFPVFPPSYPGAAGKPVYNLNGLTYGEPDAKGVRPIAAAMVCTIDSEQSHANRTEVAFLEDPELRELVPQTKFLLPGIAGAPPIERSILELPHRIADFSIRLSSIGSKMSDSIKAHSGGDCTPLLLSAPTSLIFGYWDSRSESAHRKSHQRILATKIAAFDVIPCHRHAIYSGPYSGSECASAILGDDALSADLAAAEAAGEEAATETAALMKKMSAAGFTSAPSEGLGGIIAARIERSATLSLTCIANIYCLDKDGTVLATETNAARRYIFALALLAEQYPRSTGSYNLRSGCELITTGFTTEVLNGSDEQKDALRTLIDNREELLEVAKEARDILGVPVEAAESHDVSSASMKKELEKLLKKSKKKEAASKKKTATA